MIIRKRMTLLTLIIVIGITLIISSPINATTNYPEKDIEIIVTWSVGGGTDVFVRQFVPKLEEELGVNIKVRNISGGASLIGHSYGINAKPDGYTIVAYNPPAPEFAAITHEPDFLDELKKMELISTYTWEGYALSAHPDTPYETYKDVQNGFDNGDIKILAGQTEGSFVHTVALAAREFAGLNWSSYLPYDGSGPTIAGLLKKEAKVGITSLGSTINYWNDGELRPIVLFAPERHPGMPDMPAITEFEGCEEAGFLQLRGFYAPPNTPEEIINKLERATLNVFRSEEIQEWAKETGRRLEPAGREKSKEMYENISNTIDRLLELDLIGEK